MHGAVRMLVRNGGRQVRPWPAGRFGGARKFATLAIAAGLWALCPGWVLEPPEALVRYLTWEGNEQAGCSES